MSDESGARLRHLRHMGWLLAVLSLAVVGVSAWLRLAGAGLGCADWPGCYAEFLGGATAYALPPGGRVIHRVVATSALLLAIYICWRSLRPTPLQPVARQALLTLALMLLLSVVGIWSNDPRRVFVNFINLLGGLALVSMAWRVVLATGSEAGAPSGARRDPLLAAGLATLTLTVLLGALIGARYAASTCGSFPHCDGTWWPAAPGWGSFDPFALLDGPGGLDNAGGAALHLLHRYGALTTALLLGTAAWRAWRDSATTPVVRRGAAMVLGLLGLEIACGILTVVTGYPLGLAIAHNVIAAALLAAAAHLQQHRAA